MNVSQFEKIESMLCAAARPPELRRYAVLRMKAKLVSDTEISDVLAELKQREPISHRPEVGTTRADFERMMDSAFNSRD